MIRRKEIDNTHTHTVASGSATQTDPTHDSRTTWIPEFQISTLETGAPTTCRDCSFLLRPPSCSRLGSMAYFDLVCHLSVSRWLVSHKCLSSSGAAHPILVFEKRARVHDRATFSQTLFVSIVIIVHLANWRFTVTSTHFVFASARAAEKAAVA